MDASDALHEQFGDPLPVCLGRLGVVEQRDLAAAMVAARAQQAVDVEAAIADALRRLPPGLRTAARIILRG
jgi:hypothetical protein